MRLNGAALNSVALDALRQASSATSVTPGAGSVVVTGFAPTIAAGNFLVPGLGSVVITGFAPSIDQALLPSAGSVVFTGYAPTITTGNSLVPGAGSVVFTGYAPSVTTGSSPTSVTPGVGSVVVTGFAPSVDQALLPGAGAVVVTGYAPSVDQALLPGVGSIVITGFAPNVNGGVSDTPIAVGAGSVVVTGYAPSIDGVLSGQGGPADSAADSARRRWLDHQAKRKQQRLETHGRKKKHAKAVVAPAGTKLDPEILSLGTKLEPVILSPLPPEALGTLPAHNARTTPAQRTVAIEQPDYTERAAAVAKAMQSYEALKAAIAADVAAREQAEEDDLEILLMGA